MFSRLQYISQGASVEEQLNNISEALDAGCNWIQLRFKTGSEKELLKVAKKTKELCINNNATFICNDSILLAKETNADGVHLGLLDDSVEKARTILGQDAIIGGTANTLEHVIQRINEGCDYIGVGPYRFTTTKDDLSPVLGLEGYKTILQQLSEKGFSIPLYAIGGITLEDIDALREEGVHGIALSGTVAKAKNKKEIVEQLMQKLNGKVTSW